MTDQKAFGSMALAVLIGVIHNYLLTWVWSYIAAHTPLPHLLVSQGFTGTSISAVLYPIDFILNMLLCIPAAYLLCKLRPPRIWLYLLLATLPGFLWQYRLFLADIALFQDWRIYLPGALVALLPLTVTTLVIRRIANSNASGNSVQQLPISA